MRSRERVLVFFAFATIAIAVGVGCTPPDCGNGGIKDKDGLRCSGAGVGGQGGSGGSTPVGCIPSEAEGPVGDECGVFVSSSGGDDANAGTKEKPVQTLAKAASLADTKADARRVYACAETLKIEPAAEVKLPSGVELYGGLDCDNGWAYVDGGPKTVVTAPPDTIPLRLLGGDGTTLLADVHVLAEAAAAPGGSTIALVVEGGAAKLVRAVVEAPRGAPGAVAEPELTTAGAGEDGKPGGDACSGVSTGPEGPANTCAVTSLGGSGGTGGVSQGGNGGVGEPISTANGGMGELAMASCTSGVAGEDGAPGEAGIDGMGLGTLSSSGYVGVSGAAGQPGQPGQGGGGGGGSKGGPDAMKCMGQPSTNGATGGSGASGGCGGAGGKGGGPGGASIALVSLDASLTFATTELIAGDGGPGGAGAVGQEGGAGGSKGGAGGMKPAAATALKVGCPGGRGGGGGTGGKGGRGQGGHSLAVAYKGKAPVLDGATPKIGAAGLGGTPMAANMLEIN